MLRRRKLVMLAIALAVAVCQAGSHGVIAQVQQQHAPPSVHTDTDMGIRVYSFPLLVKEQQEASYELRIYLRAVCVPTAAAAAGEGTRLRQPGTQQQQQQQQEIMIRGFAGAFPVTGSEPTGLSLFSPHFQPPAVRQHKLHIASASGGSGTAAAAANSSSSSSTVLKWLGPANQGLWHFQGRLHAPTGREVLSLEGSQVAHQLLLPCSGPLASVLGPARGGSAFPDSGVWNVITTTSANRLPPETLAHLLQLHVAYHQQLGFDGAVLRCNKGEAQALSRLPHIEALVASGRLVIWPWVHEHSTGHTPFYWQKPRNQLTLLAAAGAEGLRLAFLDLDEYLVLPQGGVLVNASCSGRPWFLQPPNAAGLDNGSGGTGTGSSSSGSGSGSSAPAWSFARYSARVCPQSPTDLECWLEQGAAAKRQQMQGAAGADAQAAEQHQQPQQPVLGLLLERCPCQFHKPILAPTRVLTMSVHFVWPAGGKRVADVPHACGFILHLHALVHARQHFMPAGLAADHLSPARWLLPATASRKSVSTFPPRVTLPGGGNVTAWLHDVAKCGALRKGAGEVHDARFSVC